MAEKSEKEEIMENFANFLLCSDFDGLSDRGRLAFENMESATTKEDKYDYLQQWAKEADKMPEFKEQKEVVKKELSRPLE